jgi:N-methylhydantoinase B
MLSASEVYGFATMAGWMGSMISDDIFGTNQWGEYFGGTILDQMAGGGGARSSEDGIDTAGFECCISVAIANVEDYELQYPLLYLFRLQLCDSGGPGKFRGGVAIENAYIVHNVGDLPTKVLSGHGVHQPEGVGIFGGYPGSTTQGIFVRRSNVRKLLAEGVLPASLDEIDGELARAANFERTSMGRDDVYVVTAGGGGGYLDPTERDPSRVESDVREGLVSVKAAEEIYGIELRDGELDGDATVRRRLEMRKARLTSA